MWWQALLTSTTHRVDLDLPNDLWQYPLHVAAFHKHAHVVARLLAAGASTTVRDRKGRTPAEDTAVPRIRDDILAAREQRRAHGAAGRVGASRL